MEFFIVLASLIVGIAIGWFLKGKAVPGNRNPEMEQELQATRVEKAAALIRLDETGKRLDEEKTRLQEVRAEMEKAFKALALEITDKNTEAFIKLAGDKFKELSDKTEKTLTQKKELIDENLGDMKKTLKTIHDQSLELRTSLENNKSETEKLRDTTSKLREILSSSQKRGQWGERMVEDILGFIGFMENKNYSKQSQVESGEKPDYTFFLPKEKKLNMDVKFPLAHYENYINSELEEERAIQKKEFLKDVKNHIKDVAGRAYINPAEGTVDYVLLFIPNESIYGFINQEDTELIDYALGKKVLLCSPLTLYAMLSLIYQATRNFAMEEKATEVMNLLNAFRQQWENYVGVMDKMGRRIDDTKKEYDLLVSTRTHQLEKPLRKIEEITAGVGVEELGE